jgi:glyoxylase-like metal-dependent hydrolase (beta-lactamase superfamily II)
MKVAAFILGPISTNTYVLWDDDTRKAVIIDPAVPSTELTNLIVSEGLIPEYIVLTHAHGDHIGGIPSLLDEFPYLKLAVGAEDRHLLADPRSNLSEQLTGASVAVHDVIELKDGDEIQVGALTLHIIATPGHTPGGLSILVDNVLFSGDTLFRASIGRTDLPGGNFDDIIKSIKEKLFLLPDETVVFPGHMSQTDIGYEKKYNPYV